MDYEENSMKVRSELLHGNSTIPPPAQFGAPPQVQVEGT